jgi:limonene-1,2-epoxide hydrolase
MEVDPPTYTLVLLGAGPRRLQVMQLLREMRPELTPGQAKAIVDGGRQMVLPAVGYWELDAVRRRFAWAGAEFETVENRTAAPSPGAESSREGSMSHTDIVRTFIAAWERRSIDDILALMTHEVRYLNVGMAEMVGHDQIRAGLTLFLGGSSAVRWSVHHIAETAAGTVLTERTDVFEMGPRTVTIPVMGVFEFAGDKISAWRDYFDVPNFQKQLA